MLDITPEPTPPPKRSRALRPVVKAAVWLKNRRSAQSVAKAIATNQVATAALVASVAAAGVGSYGAVNAHQAQDDVNRAIAAQAGAASLIRALQAELVAAKSSIAGLSDRADEAQIRNAAAFDALAARSRAVGRSMSALAGQVAAMPSQDPQTAVLARQVAATARSAEAAMQEARKASAAAAQDNPDTQARAAAAQASQDAQKASQDAAGAQAAADRAQADAKYAPIVLTFPDGGPYERSFILPEQGVYTVTLAYGGDGALFASMQAGDGTVPRGTRNVFIDYLPQHFNAFSEGTVTDASVTFTLSRATP